MVSRPEAGEVPEGGLRGPCMRSDGSPQISAPVVGPGSTFCLSAFLTCWSERETGDLVKVAGSQNGGRTPPVLPEGQAACEGGLKRKDPNREAGILALVGTLGGPRAV